MITSEADIVSNVSTGMLYAYSMGMVDAAANNDEWPGGSHAFGSASCQLQIKSRSGAIAFCARDASMFVCRRK